MLPLTAMAKVLRRCLCLLISIVDASSSIIIRLPCLHCRLHCRLHYCCSLTSSSAAKQGNCDKRASFTRCKQNQAVEGEEGEEEEEEEEEDGWLRDGGSAQLGRRKGRKEGRKAGTNQWPGERRC